MAPKRRAEIVDLTADDAPDGSSYRASKQSHMTSGDIWDVDDEYDEDAVSQEAPDATQGYSEQHYNYLLEPRDRYDANVIRVDNVQGEQIGHILRGLAAKLAKYMDNGSLLIEAQITGHKGYYECPIELQLYGTDDPIKRQELIAKEAAKQMKKGAKGVDLEDIITGSERFNPRNIEEDLAAMPQAP
ncbi:hypothetical protein COCC4DRAFT_71487 [Bipolaris maydis ATCC 48331]|uniref:HIRAN domain-containing protein n=2 Tax=Cochliobolus heterostrophus TaxID=5016 RepID=M2T0I8_COCH5|nr:uncharacterized protein COCC4DRAFT_71487 [Bipolaris maydis ATCC 48331]EMD91130.1 hypothetical protein COCHEDRAFT_1225129 [Bipolaris maydis C5]ENI05789.1 hypothetical protein COCC4DRAFT_71487 [Bipolaris maydis ATCC 48331]KAJ6205088.1 hypothetical protein PSV09DRAFT_1225129 [Bipolaris maydis]